MDVKQLVRDLMEVAFDGPSEAKVFPKTDDLETPTEWKARIEAAGRAYLDDPTCSCARGDGWVEGLDGVLLPFCARCGRQRLPDSMMPS